MTSLARRYISDVARHLHLASTDQDDILTEIRDHIEDAARELEDEGLPSDAAISYAIDELGRPQSLADQMYTVHTQGSWYHTALAVLPHIALSVLIRLRSVGHAGLASNSPGGGARDQRPGLEKGTA